MWRSSFPALTLAAALSKWPELVLCLLGELGGEGRLALPLRECSFGRSEMAEDTL